MAPSKMRPRQTRLAFTPLPSSSPAAKGYNKQIQDRAAAVSLDSSPGPAKRRKLGSDDLPQMDGGNDSMPTPDASAMPPHFGDEVEIVDSDSEPIRSTQRRPSTQDKVVSKKRTNQPRLDFSNTRDTDSFSSPIKLSSPSRPRSSGRAGLFGTQRQRPVMDISSDESDDLPSPGKLMRNVKRKNKEKSATVSRTRSAPTTRSAQSITIGSESEEESIAVGRAPADRIGEQSEDESDDMPTTIGKQRRKRARRGSHNSFISSPPPRMIESDDELEIIEKLSKRSRRDESDDESERETPKQRLKRRKASQREKDELAEDVEFLGPSSDIEDSARKPRSTQSAKKDARTQALERLKRQRAGSRVESEEPDEPEEIDEDLDRNQMFNEDDYDQDFIEEDDHDDALGVPDDLPLEFTRYASMKPKELFKYAVEWMIQKKINPAFEIKDPLYDLTFRKLDDEVKGLAGSKFTSAAWTPEFTIALNARPDIAFEPIDRNSDEHWLRDHCDACNRSKHPATYQIQFQGKTYNRQTLEDLPRNNDDDDDGSSSDDEEENAGDEPDYDANGQEVSSEMTIFYCGKFCTANAKTAHALQHWRYHLNEWVVNWLSKEGYCTDEMVVRRDKQSTKKRRREANKITDRMEQEGVIKSLWKDFYGNIDEARNSKQGRYSFESP